MRCASSRRPRLPLVSSSTLKLDPVPISRSIDFQLYVSHSAIFRDTALADRCQPSLLFEKRQATLCLSFSKVTHGDELRDLGFPRFGLTTFVLVHHLATHACE